MSRPNSEKLLSLMGETNCNVNYVQKLLGCSQRSAYAWIGNGPHARDMPSGELERLCLILSRLGHTSDIINEVTGKMLARIKSN